MKKFFLFTATILLSMGLFAQSDEGQAVQRKKEAKHTTSADSKSIKHDKQGPSKDFELPGLTDEQRNTIKDLQLAMAKDIRANAKLLQEKQARLVLLQGQKQPNRAAINSTIDEITALQGQIMKTRADVRAKISEMLTEEQRAIFQQNANKRAQTARQEGEMRKAEGRTRVAEGRMQKTKDVKAIRAAKNQNCEKPTATEKE